MRLRVCGCATCKSEALLKASLLQGVRVQGTHSSVTGCLSSVRRYVFIVTSSLSPLACRNTSAKMLALSEASWRLFEGAPCAAALLLPCLAIFVRVVMSRTLSSVAIPLRFVSSRCQTELLSNRRVWCSFCRSA